jgi:uncharacterized protein (TIGR02147 family)
VAGRPDVYEYLDYRVFLADYYRYKKVNGRGFSYRAFAKRAGVRAQNYLKLVVDGARNLSREMAGRFADACDLRGEEASYFQDLVAFNQAENPTERNRQYQRLSTFRRYRRAHQLELAQAAYHSTWYLPAIREMVLRPDFREDPAWIARTLRPRITRAEAARAIETLLSLQLLVRDEEGRLRQADALVSTGAETAGLHIWSYHRMMMERAGAALELFAAAERDISALTLCLSKDGLAEVKERIRKFRRELLNYSVDQDDPEQVVQINFQLFPLTARRDES